ncbi:MAG TPA: heavy metal translocating P-type ATPase [Clostridiaceae bacterium]|nr:heavy metal translocating P-type ATPase [Clostridiaceae bacterium]
MKNYKYILEGLDCASCAKKVEDKIASTDGYEDVTVNFSTLKLSFKTNKNNPKKEIIEIVKALEPDVNVVDMEESNKKKDSKESFHIARIIIGILIYFLGTKLNFNTNIQIVLIIVSIIILLSRTMKKAFMQIRKGVLDENALITISVIGACLVNKVMEGVMVITLYEIGKILESKAISKTRKSISDLMNIKPEYANLKNGEEYQQVNPEEVNVGDIILVKTGEKIPLDGIVLKGEAELDNSALTGESAFVKVKEKSKVLSGAINVQGILEIKVEKNYENSTVSQILNLVENATDKKAKTETFVAKAAKIYTPIVLGLALLVAIFMPILIKGSTYYDSIYKALIFLVISCPCSIAISVPLSYFSGIGKASKKGILIKGSDYLDGIKDIGQILFDKTGTITTGKFKVSKIKTYNGKYSENEILNYFAMGESFSNHPLAKSILEMVNDEIDTTKVKDFEEISGKGLKYTYNNMKIKIGNAEFVDSKEKIDEKGTILYLKIEDEITGGIVLTDEIKSDAKETIKQLKELGIKTKMLTGDKKEVATRIAKEVNIDEVKSEMLPQDKYNELEKVLDNNITEKKVAYVGDGINDSPVLARADIGISMGGIGSNSAIEASDMVIMTDELKKIIEAIQISKKTNRIIKENLIFSIGVKILILLLSILGIADMWEAVFADVGTTLITIFNTIRILK